MPSESERFCELCVSSESTPQRRESVHLPFEIISNIISLIKLERDHQKTLHSCCLVSRSWYSVAIASLYTYPIPGKKKYRSFVRTICSSKDVHIIKSPFSEYVKSLDLSALPDNVPERVAEQLLAKVKTGLELFVAPNMQLSVNCLAALSRCQNLVRLDLSLVDPSFSIFDLLDALSKLSSLNILHFPKGTAAFPDSDWEMNDYERCRKIPEWQDGFETVHVPCSLDWGYLLIFRECPASLRTLVIEDGFGKPIGALERVFPLMRQEIIDLKLKYDGELLDLPENILEAFPKLLHLGVGPHFISDDILYDIDLDADHPLRSVTIYFKKLDDLFDPEFQRCLEDLLDEDRLPNLSNISLLNESPSIDHWVPFLQEHPSPRKFVYLFAIGKLLKQRSSSPSDRKESGLWLVDGEENNGAVCELTVENVERMMRGLPV